MFKKIYLLFIVIGLLSLSAKQIDLSENIKIINQCDDVNLTKYQLLFYDKEEAYAFRYGLKNKSSNMKKIKLMLLFKDDNNNTIADIETFEKVKPHYRKAFNPSMYTSKKFNEVGKEFSGFTELKITCKDEKKKIKTGFVQIPVKIEIWDKFKNKYKSEIMARLKLLELIAKDISK